MRRRWRVKRKCSACPFHETGPGRFLRDTLRPTRWRAILQALANGEFFTCHKTSDETGNGTNLVCAGSIEWQDRNNYSSAYVRLSQYLDKKVKGGVRG